MNSEFLITHDRAKSQSKANALQAVKDMNLPRKITISSDSFLGLGPKTIRKAIKELEQLREVHEENLPYLFGIALRESHFACCDGASYIALMIESGHHGDDEYTQELATPDGYGDIEGVAYSLLNSLGDLIESHEQSVFREGTPYKERLPDGEILNSIALYWFAIAADALRSGNSISAANWTHEAYDALSLAHGNYMWTSAEEETRKDCKSDPFNAEAAARSAIGKRAAQARHTENHAMKADVFAWLDSVTPEFKVAEVAARAIVKQQPITHVTARNWFNKWKKLRSASTP
jgi:hypothetical protein